MCEILKQHFDCNLLYYLQMEAEIPETHTHTKEGQRAAKGMVHITAL